MSSATEKKTKATVVVENVSLTEITRMVDELIKGKNYKAKADTFYEKNRKKLIAIIDHTKQTIFYGSAKKLVFTKGKRRVLNQKKLAAHFGGVIPDKFFSDTPSWECAIQDLD